MGEGEIQLFYKIIEVFHFRCKSVELNEMKMLSYIYPCSRYTHGHKTWLNKYGSWEDLVKLLKFNSDGVEIEIVAAVKV